MNDRFAALSWSVPCGRWFATHVRVSAFFVGVPLILMVRFGPTMGGALTLALFVATLLHEYGHVFACRFLGGAADEILIWPLGGLATLHHPRSTSGRMLTIAAGPAVNLVCCVATWPVFYAPQQLRSVLIPFEVPIFEFTEASWTVDARLVFFVVNWVMLLINLIPALPLDGGQLLWTSWQAQSGSEAAFHGVTMVGLASGWIAMAIGLMGSWPWAVALGAILLLINMASWNNRGMDDSSEDSFLGYDFSQGYTSLERTSSEESRRSPSLSWWQRWQQRRRQQRTERERTRLVDLEQQLDLLLAKVHENGLESLTAAERRRLREASEALRDRTKKPS